MASPEGPASTPPERPPALSPDATLLHSSGGPVDGTAASLVPSSPGAPPDFLAAPAVEHAAPVLRALAAAAVPARLAAALAGRYTIERILGSGGMAVVYLARDERHGRHVALKVIRPDLTVHPLGARRFVREVATTAPLVHPHIVPLHDSGEADGVPWYVMAHVEGESLRARLRREGPLPLADAMRIAHEVADALDYAHRHAVVHRDVKPENVLFQDGHALVADFGIAHLMRDLLDDGPGSPATDSLTMTGGVVGTAAYMSPEQASGEPCIDGRSDVYALGCVLFEMLTGRAPFTGTTVEVVRQHLEAAPPAVGALRADVPPAVARALERALAKRPADRFATAAEFAGALAAWRELAPRHLERRTARIAALLLVIAIGGIAAARSGVGSGPGMVQPGARILVADVVGPASDSTLGHVVSQALATDLGQSRRIRVVTAGEVRETLARMRRDSVHRLDPSLAREVALREGIAAVVEGEVHRVGDSGYELFARLRSVDSGRVLVQVRRTAPHAGALIPAVDQLSDDLRSAMGDAWMVRLASPPLAEVTTGSLEALRKYTQGLRAWHMEGSASRGAALLEEAIALDSGFAMAYRALGHLPPSRGAYAAHVHGMLRKAYEHRHRLTERERLLVTGDYHSFNGFDFQPIRALVAYEQLIRLDPAGHDPEGLNQAGLLREHLGNFAGAVEYFSRVLATDSSAAAVVYSNLVRAQLSLGRVADARTTIERMSRRLPTHPRFFEARSWLAFSTGDHDSVRTHMRQLLEAHPAEPAARGTALGMLFAAALVQGRAREALAVGQAAAAASRERGALGGALMSDLNHARVLASLLGDSTGARDSVRAALARMPLTADVRNDDAPHLQFARICAFTGHPSCAHRFMRRFEERRRWQAENGWRSDAFSKQAFHLALGAIALNEGRYADARTEFRAAARTDYCVICADAQLGDAFHALGERDSARVAYERYVTTPFGRRDRLDPWLLPRALRRLGELYEGHDPVKAAYYYTRFIELWREADPEVQPQVEDVRRRLARLRPG